MNTPINIPEYQVSQFNRLFRDVIETNFSYVRIKGEISEIRRATRGQLYLTLKDDESILSSVIWENKKKDLQFSPEVGMEVVVTGKVTTWSKFKTTYQIDIDKVELAGEGALIKLIEDRKKRLRAKGYFDALHKRSLPFLPNKIGVITSPMGSVIHDIINRIQDRFPTSIDVWPVAVQGPDAVETIITAIRGFNSVIFQDKPDVIIVARGGGSTEDLMAFNDEELAQVVFESTIPIISAIGHETDTTIIDYVSDLRASTPTAAAEKVVPVRIDLNRIINNLSQRLTHCVKSNFNKYNDRLINLSKFLKAPNLVIKIFKERLKGAVENLYKEIGLIVRKNIYGLNSYKKLLRSPSTSVQIKKDKLQNFSKNLDRCVNENLRNLKKELNKFDSLLFSNSMRKTLKKGYSIVSKSKKIINNSELIQREDKIKIQFFDKSINIKIKKIN
ncbi:exodeoxyribonuclease VII large subunit [Alphaproteobacteria bacterium]|nr:exodeoxyribonuclease VII large subunit [Alphaproteobacteria bacterium]